MLRFSRLPAVMVNQNNVKAAVSNTFKPQKVKY